MTKDKENKGGSDGGELLPRNQKALQGFKTLKELKFSKTRMIVKIGKKGAPDEIVAILMKLIATFKDKYY